MAETPKERIDRELIELLNELRVVLPGVQVLFAFLLTIPFSDRYGDLSQAQRWVFLGTFLATLTATACFTAPTAYHRSRFRDGDKTRLVHASNRFAIVGMVLLAVALTGASLLVAGLIYDGPIAWVLTGLALAVLLWCWFGLPLTRKLSEEDG